MSKAGSSTANTRLYRQRLRAAGSEEVLFQLPRATVVLLDDLKKRQGLRRVASEGVVEIWSPMTV